MRRKRREGRLVSKNLAEARRDHWSDHTASEEQYVLSDILRFLFSKIYLILFYIKATVCTNLPHCSLFSPNIWFNIEQLSKAWDRIRLTQQILAFTSVAVIEGICMTCLLLGKLSQIMSHLSCGQIISMMSSKTKHAVVKNKTTKQNTIRKIEDYGVCGRETN